LRINLGAGFTDLFTDEGSRIIATFKVYDGRVELFYKEDGNLFTVYVSWLNTLRDMVIVVDVKPSILPRRIIIDAQTTTYP
jgi:hypothetical protein